LPSPDSGEAKTYPSIRSLISLSYLPEIIGSLLINDSVIDGIALNDIYNSTLELLHKLSSSEPTVGILVEERWEEQRSGGIESWSWLLIRLPFSAPHPYMIDLKD